MPNLNLTTVVSAMANSKKRFPRCILKSKNTQGKKPFLVIILGNGTLQKSLAVFLQSKLGLLPVDDSLLVENSHEVLDFISQRSHQGMCAFSIDAKDLYYSLPHDLLLSCIEECIDKFGCIAFENSAGVPPDSF